MKSNKSKNDGFLNILKKIKEIFFKEDTKKIDDSMCKLNLPIIDIYENEEYYDLKFLEIDSLSFDFRKTRKKYPVLKDIKKCKAQDSKEIDKFLKEVYNQLTEDVHSALNEKTNKEIV